MKKIFFSLLAIGAIASCAKTEPVYMDGDSEIILAPVTSMVTKADKMGAVDGTQYPAEEEFGVYAYWAAAGAGSTFTADETDAGAYLGTPAAGVGVEFTKKGDWFWGGTKPYYWPKNGSLRFAAYSPATVAAKYPVVHKLDGDVYTITDYVQEHNTAKTVDLLLAPTSVSYTAATAVDDVDVVFEHALAWITLEAKAADEVAAQAFVIGDVTIDNVKTKGTLTAAMADGIQVDEWVPADGSEQSYAVGSKVTTLTTTAQNIDKVENGTVIIPQATTTVTIKYTQNSVNGSAQLDNQEITVPLLLDGNNTPWEPGKHYIYTLIFGLDEILITPSVVEWEEVVVPAVDATATEVANAAELISAVAAGRNVRLTSDIVITEPVVVNGGNVLVELNGYAVNSTVDGFEVAAGTLTINGPGAVNAATNDEEPYCAVWAYGDAVVNINGGEFSAGYPAGDYNDLIYAKGNAKINIYGGKFYNSGKENAFVLNLKDADRATAAITVYGGSFEKFNPADNASENEGHSFVAKGHNVVSSGDWYTVYPSEGANIVLDAPTTFVTTINVKNGTFDGAGNALTVTAAPENTASTYGLVCPEGNVTISNVTIDGREFKTTNGKGLRGIYVTKGGNYVVENVVVKDVTYAINVNTTAPVTLAVKNSELEGWTSYGNSTSASFENVAFTCGEYANFKPYTNVTLAGCSFADGFMIDFTSLDGIITFKNCTYNGVLLTAENFATTAKADGYDAAKVAF